MPRTLLLLAVLVLPLASPTAALAEDHFLTIGGGYGLQGNQVSLERNVLFQRRVLEKVRPEAPRPETYFAAGEANRPDLQYRDPNFETECPKARRLMGEIFGDRDDISLRYRQHEMGEIAGPADPDVLRRRFKKLARELKDGDRLFIYFTGHGGEAEAPDAYYDEEEGYYDEEYAYEYEEEPEYNKHNTVAYFWDDAEMTAAEFSEELDRLPERVTVVMVMVQCYAGGFAHTIFHQADEDLGLADHQRCGFFSQRHDRYAAGCTPEVNEEEYQEYSSFFWAAIGGETRDGKPITTADYNGDGAISLAEAHAYAVIESDTIDIPIRTTGALLRKYSALGPKESGDEDDDDDSSNPFGALLGVFTKQDDATDGKELTELTGPLADLTKRARPDQRAIVDALADQLGLTEAPTVEAVRGKLKQIEKRGVKTDGMGRLASRSVRRARRKLREALTERWPELSVEYSPVVAELGAERADEFVAAVEGLPAFQAHQRALARYEKLAEDREQLDHLEAKVERLLRTCENIVLAANLPLVAPEEIVKRYEGLLELEESCVAKPQAMAGSE